jgi:hypothetical protein
MRSRGDFYARTNSPPVSVSLISCLSLADRECDHPFVDFHGIFGPSLLDSAYALAGETMGTRPVNALRRVSACTRSV